MENFEYIEPKSLKDAVALLAKFKNEAKLLAGGTDLIAALKSGLPGLLTSTMVTASLA